MRKTARTFSIAAALAVMIPLSAYAATSDDSGAKAENKPVTSAVSGEHKGHGPRGGFGGKEEAIGQDVLDLLKLDKDALAAKLKAGDTLAEIAEAQGVSRESLKKALTVAFDKKLEERKQAYADGLDKLIDSELKGGAGDFGRGGIGKKGIGRTPLDLTAAATALGLSAEELKAALAEGEGKSLAAIAKEKGIDAQKVIDAVAASITTGINQAVTDGKLTQEEAAKRLAEVPTIAAKIVNETGFAHGGKPGGHRDGGRGFGGERAGKGAGETPSASASPTASVQS
ncbi:hypothetical protein [Cohnella sp. GCM10027633]|uniref:hypothetical protein n=1 Tax=unclassified Cohnella TaxID=2636738 RepID=UPI00362BF8E1